MSISPNYGVALALSIGNTFSVNTLEFLETKGRGYKWFAKESTQEINLIPPSG